MMHNVLIQKETSSDPLTLMMPLDRQKKITKVRVVLEKVVTRQGASLRHLYDIIYEYEDQKGLEDPPLSVIFRALFFNTSVA